MLEAAAIWKRPLDSCKFYKEQLAEAGFTNIEEKIYKWPSNPWPKDPKYKELGKPASCSALTRDIGPKC